MRKVMRWWVVVGGVFAIGAGVATQPGGAGKLPFTVSREMTGMVEPLNGDGLPDYVRVLNDEAGEGVPAQENGVVAWLRIVGTERGSWGNYGGQWQGVMRRLGVKELPAKGEWEPIEVYLNGGREGSTGTEDDRLTALGRRLWKAEEDKEVAAYVLKEAGALGKLRAIAAGEGWYAPVVRFEDQFPEEDFLVTLREGGEALAAEGTLAFGQGDFDKFFSDVQAEMLLARKVDRGPELRSRMEAWTLEESADGALGTALGSGRCTKGQVARIRGLLASMKPLAGLVDCVDRRERWELLDALMCMEMAQADWDKEPREFQQWLAGLWDYVKEVHWQDVQGDALLRAANGLVNEQVTALRQPTPQAVRAGVEAVNKQVIAWRLANDRSGRDLSWKEGESREAYSERMAHVFLTWFTGNLQFAAAKCQEGQMEDGMVQVLLAAGTYRADAGKWPVTLEALVPGYLRAVPADVYTKEAKVGVAYGFSDPGVYLFSVGKNGRDDGGAEDDVVVGVR